jgi:hypothetical protein
MNTRTTINIAGLDKAEILAVLFNNSQPLGMGFLQALVQGNHDMTVEEARSLINREQLADNDFGFNTRQGSDGKQYGFDYVRGRPMKINLEGDEFDPWGYDRDNGGDGTAKRLIDSLR